MNDPPLTPELRARLAEKGRILYRKACGIGGGGSCVEGFVDHQLRMGRTEVVNDLLGFLESQPSTSEELRRLVVALRLRLES